MKPHHRPLVFGLGICALALAGFVALFTQLLYPSPMVAFDRDVVHTMREFSQQETNIGYGMIGLTILGGVPAMILLALAGAGWSWWRKQYFLLLAWVAIPVGGGILNFTLKTVINRQRPPIDLRDPFVNETNQSFPSGHAMGSTIGIGVLGYTFWLQLRGRKRKWAVAAGLAIVVLGVGLSRVYLRAHWLSDVMAGFLIGTAWLALGIGVIEMLRTKQGERMPEEVKGS